MNRLKVTLFISLISIIFSCSDEEPDEPSLKFLGITETNSQGLIIGVIDESDWQHNDTWSEMEISLFPDYKNLNNEGINEELSSGIGSAFPNPTTGIVDFHITNLENLEFGAWKLVNEKLETIIETSFSVSPSSIGFGLQTDLSTYEPEVYRFYYLYKLREVKYIFKGHGDVQLLE